MKRVTVFLVVCALVVALGVGNAAAAWVTATISQAGSCSFGVSRKPRRTADSPS